MAQPGIPFGPHRAVVAVADSARTIATVLLQNEYGDRLNSLPEKVDLDTLDRICKKAIEWEVVLEAKLLEAAANSYRAEKAQDNK